MLCRHLEGGEYMLALLGGDILENGWQGSTAYCLTFHDSTTINIFIYICLLKNNVTFLTQTLLVAVMSNVLKIETVISIAYFRKKWRRAMMRYIRIYHVKNGYRL
jgi:hypothetical protein